MIVIKEIVEFINNIPTILQYVVYGYVYLIAYYWISFKDNKSFNDTIIKSVATSYIIIILFDYVLLKLNLKINDNVYRTIILLLISAISGFLIGTISTHRWFNVLLYKCHIVRTTNSNIWDNVIKPRTWLRIFMNDGSSYLGQYRFGETFKSEPIIVLATYQKLNSKDEVVLDYSNDLREMIMINTKDFDRIEIVYR